MRYRVIRPGTLIFFLPYQTEEEDYFFIPEYNLYIISRLNENGYTLAFILDKKIKVKRLCKQGDVAVKGKKKDIPWRGFETEYMLSLVPLNCDDETAVAMLIVDIYSGDTIFHWDKIAHLIFTEELYNYLEWLKENRGIDYEVVS